MLPHMARRKLDGAETLTLTNISSVKTIMADDNKPDSAPTKAAEKPTSTADADLTKYKVRCFVKGCPRDEKNEANTFVD
jgi:hypothetical protein